jgi:hypothetical protein
VWNLQGIVTAWSSREQALTRMKAGSMEAQKLCPYRWIARAFH